MLSTLARRATTLSLSSSSQWLTRPTSATVAATGGRHCQWLSSTTAAAVPEDSDSPPRPSNHSFLVVNAVGKDRPGIVAEMTKRVTDMGGNVGESQAAKLGSHFGLMMLVSVPPTKVSQLQESLATMTDMSTTCFPTNDPHVVTPKVAYSGHFTLSGADHPGIVHSVTALLAKHNLNIDKMETSAEEAPFGGTTLYVMEGIAQAFQPLPSSFDLATIRQELKTLGEDLNCDISLEGVIVVEELGQE